MKYNDQSRLRELLADPQALAVIERHIPGATAHPQLDMALDMSLREISWYPESGLTPAKLKAIVEDLEKI
jgi:para-nitrobenzyl esterase